MIEDAKRSIAFPLSRVPQTGDCRTDGVPTGRRRRRRPCPCGQSAVEVALLGDQVRLTVPLPLL